MATTDIGQDRLNGDPLFDDDMPEEDEGAQMTLVEHLGELRKRLFISALAVVVGTILGFIFFDPILHFLLLPLPREADALTGAGGTTKLVVTQVGEGFTVALKVAIATGVVAATPVWIYQLWAFISPALTRREKKYALPFTLIGIGLFVLGLAVGFVTLRFPINWLVNFGSGDFVHLITADSYFSFTAFFMLAFGITFELPLVLTFLSLIGIVSSEMLRKNRSYILVGLWVASCFITPGSDPYSPVILGVALTFLFFVSTILIRAIKR